MKKLDEIMEVMTDELDGFNKSISKLEKLSKNIKDIDVKADSSKIEHLLKEHLKEQSGLLLQCTNEIGDTNKNLKRAKLTPKWLLALFCIASAITMLTMGYFGYRIIGFEDEKEEAYNNGKKEIISELRAYFNEYPDAYTDYEKWSQKQDPVPSKK